jgi:hypothetical protein
MLKLFDRNWLIIVMFFTIAAMPFRTFANEPSVIFSEIAWAGSSISSSDEWIEMVNVSDSVVDVSGWTISGAASGGKIITLPEESFIEPHSTFIIANYESNHENSSLKNEPNFTTASLSLPNGGFSLDLYDNENAHVDVAGSDGPPIAGRSGGTQDSDDGRYTSMVRISELANGSSKYAWVSATETHGLKDGLSDYGTPGIWTAQTFVPDPEETSSSTQEEVQIQEETITSNSLQINEFVSNPNTEEVEWIELKNISSEPIDTTGWTTEDAKAKVTTLNAQTLQSGELLVIEAPLGKLNNEGDTIIVRNADQEIQEQLSYGTDELAAPKKGTSLARNSANEFEMTYTPTAGESNVFNDKPEETVEEVATQEEEEDLSHDSADTSTSDEVYIEHVLISEFVSDPEDDIEWIELFNPTKRAIQLTDWTLEDETKKVTLLSGEVAAGDYRVFYAPKAKLNNGGDVITLRNDAAVVMDTVEYGTKDIAYPRKGESLSLNGDVFERTQLLTPGKPNLIFIAKTDDRKTDDAKNETEEAKEEVSKSQDNETTKVEDVQKDTKPSLTTVRFVELYPNTTGTDADEEYIIIQNIGSESIDLKDWRIEDASQDDYTFAESTTLEPGTSLKLDREKTHIALNNTGDTLKLITPDNNSVDQLTYTTAPKSARYVKSGSGWSWVNKIVTTSSTPASSSATTNSSSTYVSNTTIQVQTIQLKAIAQAKLSPDGTDVHVQGEVIAMPDTFARQTMYIMDETGGVQIYFYNADFPNLTLGQVVKVKGELSTNHSERRIKVSNYEDITLIQSTLTNTVSQHEINELDETLVGKLITVSGQLQSRSSTKLIIEKSGDTLNVYLNSNPTIDPNQYTYQDTLTITGVLTRYDDTLRIRPRNTSDISVEQAPVLLTGTTNIGKSVRDSRQSQTGLIVLFSTIASLLLLVLWRYIPSRRLTLTS